MIIYINVRESNLTLSEIDLLNASGPSITSDDINALNSLWQEFLNQVVRLNDPRLEYSQWSNRETLLVGKGGPM